MNKNVRSEKNGNIPLGKDLDIFPFPSDEFDKIIRVDFSQANLSISNNGQKKNSNNIKPSTALSLSEGPNESSELASKVNSSGFEHDLALKIVISTQDSFNTFITENIKQSCVIGNEFKPLNVLSKQKVADFEEQLLQYLIHGYQLKEKTICNLLKSKIVSREMGSIEDLVILLKGELTEKELYLLAFSFYLAKKYDDALAHLSLIPKLGYKELYLRGVLFSQLANLENAASDLQQVYPAFSADITYLELAIDVFRKKGCNNYLIKSLKKAFQIAPEKIEYSNELIDLLFIQGDFLKIIAYIKQLVAISGSISAENQYKLGISYGMLGLDEAARGRFESILGMSNLSYLDALYKMQDNVFADDKIVFLLAFYFFQEKSYDKCLEYLLRQSLDLVDRIALLAGHCYILKNDFVKATEVLHSKAILLEYLLPEFNYLQGILHYGLGEIEKAEESFKLSADMGFLGEKLYFYRAIIAFSQDDFLKALEYYKQSLNHGYREADVYRGMALVATNLQMYNAALSAYKDLKGICPDDFRIDNAMGILYAKLKDYKKSISSFKNVLKLDEYNKEAHWNLSLAYKLVLEDNIQMHLEKFSEIDIIGDGDLVG